MIDSLVPGNPITTTMAVARATRGKIVPATLAATVSTVLLIPGQAQAVGATPTQVTAPARQITSAQPVTPTLLSHPVVSHHPNLSPEQC